MLTRRAALRAILAAPAFRFVPFEPERLARRITLSANVTLTFTPGTDVVALKLLQDGRSVTWPSNITWKGGRL